MIDIDALDPKIKPIVVLLNENGIETYESCQGGIGHAFPMPTVRFHGERSEGFRVLAIAQANGLHLAEMRRFWSINDGEPVGPSWEITFLVD